MCRRGRAYLKYEFLLNFIKNIQKKIYRLQNLFFTHILLWDIVRKWIPSDKICSTYTGIQRPKKPTDTKSYQEITSGSEFESERVIFIFQTICKRFVKYYIT